MKRYIKAAVRPVTDEDFNVQRKLADNPNTNPRTLDALANTSGRTSWIRERVAVNPNTSVETLAHLAKDPYPRVREALLRNSKVPTTLRDSIMRSLSDWSGKVTYILDIAFTQLDLDARFNVQETIDDIKYYLDHIVVGDTRAHLNYTSVEYISFNEESWEEHIFTIDCDGLYDESSIRDVGNTLKEIISDAKYTVCDWKVDRYLK